MAVTTNVLARFSASSPLRQAVSAIYKCVELCVLAASAADQIVFSLDRNEVFA
jgi:hypothetical protein